MADALLTDADLGLSFPASGSAGPATTPADLPDDHEITVTRATAAPKAPPIPSPVDAPASAVPLPAAGGAGTAAKLFTDQDLGITAPKDAGPLANAPDDTYASGAAKGLGTAAIKAFGNTVGFVGGLGSLADYLVARGEHALTGKPVEDILSDLQKAKTAQQQSSTLPAWLDPRSVLPAPADVSAPILAKTGEYIPTTEPGKIAQAGAETALSAIGPGAGAKVGTYGQVLRGAAAAAPINAVAGGAAQGATDLTGDPLVGLGTALAAGGLAHAGAAGLNKAASPIAMGARLDGVPVVGPAIAAARDNAAAGRVLAQSSDPAALRDWAAQPSEPSGVPSSPQTTAGAVGNDLGLFQAEKAARTVDNTPFNAVDQSQSRAQQSAITEAQPDGDVFRPGQVIRSRLDAIDAAAQAAEDQLNAAHQSAVAGRAQTDQQAQDSLVQAFQAAHDRATQVAAAAAEPITSAPSADQTGATLRTALEGSKAAAKEARDQLYRAVDPDGTLATVVSPLKAAKEAIKAEIDPHTGVQPAGAEAKLWSDIDRLPDVVPFKSLQKLDSRVSRAMSAERQNPNAEDPEAISRLTRLKSATMDAIHNAVEHQAAHEARLVQGGVIAPEDTIEGRWEQALERSRQQYYADQNAIVGRSAQAGTGTDGAGRQGSVRPAAGGQSSTRGRSNDAPSDQGVEGEVGLTPNFDQAASQRLTEAKAAHADYAQTYRNSTVKPAFDTTGYVGQYRLPNGSLPAKAVVSGDRGYETARAFLNAAGNDPRAVTAMQDAATAMLRKNVPPAGNLHPNALARWKEAYGPAIRAIDEAVPGFSGRFDNAANATQTLLDMGVQQKQQLRDFQQARAADALAANSASGAQTKAQIADIKQRTKEAHASPAGRFAGQGGDRIAASEVENAVGNMLKTGTAGATNMRLLVASVANDPEAIAGLRKAGVDYMVRNFQNADGSMSGAKYIDFYRDNKDVLKELYPTAQVSMFGAVARDIEANAAWRTQTAIKSGSDTARNAHATMGDAAKNVAKHGSMLFIAAEAMREGFDRGGVKGAALAGTGAAAAYLVSGLRSAGIRSVNDLYREALLDPEKAKYLISKMPESPQGGKLRALTGLLRRELIVGQEQASRRQ